MNNKKNGLSLATKAKIGAAVLGVLLLFGLWVRPHVFSTTYTGVVTKTETKRYSNEDVYLVHFKVDGEEKVRVFKNEDSWLRLKFNSSDVQANLLKDGRYEVDVVGRRWHWPTSYQNIVNYESIDQ